MSKTMAALITDEKITQALAEVIDPKLGLNIVDLGLLYSQEVSKDGHVAIVMTLTTPGCPDTSG